MLNFALENELFGINASGGLLVNHRFLTAKLKHILRSQKICIKVPIKRNFGLSCYCLT